MLTRRPRLTQIFGSLTILLLSGVVCAEPWLPPGDLALRSDIQILADAGVIKAPVMVWPLRWADISRDVLASSDADYADSVIGLSLARVTRRVRREMRTSGIQPHFRASASEKPRSIRTFEDTPRETGELEVGAQWQGDRIAYRLQVTGAVDPQDDKSVRADGSYVTAVWGNTLFSVSAMDRWWGPGWEGSLILSNNARPVPMISIERNYSDPFNTKWLSWIGPWSAQIFFGQLESDRAVPDTQLFGLRLDFRPIPSLQIALSRTALWCGEGRPCDLETFWDLLIGNDNEGPNTPGDQLAGIDVRWAGSPTKFPFAIYTQWIGEDEADSLPSKYLGLFGIENSGALFDTGRTYNVHLEYADTACGFNESNPTFDCAYNHFIYQSGYRYRRRSMGHPADNDTQTLSLGGVVVGNDGSSWSGLVRWADLNRAALPDPANSVAMTPQTLYNIELSHNREIRWGSISVGIGFDNLEDELTGNSSDDIRAFLQWTSRP